MKVEAIDLFCGVGGLTCGLRASGINVVAGADIDPSCEFSYKNNNKAKFICSDIGNIDSADLEALYSDQTVKRVMVGCAPCQPFSTHSHKYKDKETDARWDLVGTFFNHVKAVQPDVVSMENVPGLAKQTVFKNFVDNLREQGYFVSYQVVFCPDYGIPQTRRRLVVLASKLGEIDLMPPTHDREKPVTIKDTIYQLDPLDHGTVSDKDPLHVCSKLSELNYQRIIASKPGGTWHDWDENLLADCHKRASGSSFTSVYGRLSWDQPSSTITTQFHRFGTGRFGHPEQNRALSLREGAMIQTFPKNYKFIPEGAEVNFTQIGRHIGNAVPPRLGEIVGLSIKKHLEKFN